MRDVVDAEHLGACGQQRGRGDGGDLAAHDLQGRDEAAAHTGVPDVADDADLQAVETALGLPDGVQVEQGLRGMLMLAVACVDDVDAGHVGDLARHAGVLVAH